MPSNVEIKARVNDFETLKKKAKELSASEGNPLVSSPERFRNTPRLRVSERFAGMSFTLDCLRVHVILSEISDEMYAHWNC